MADLVRTISCSFKPQISILLDGETEEYDQPITYAPGDEIKGFVYVRPPSEILDCQFDVELIGEP